MKFTPPPSHTAVHVMAEFYRRARNADLDVWLYYRGKTNTGRKCTFSGVLVLGDKVIAIVAAKRSPNAARRMTRQRVRYESFGVPVIWIRGMERVPSAVMEAKRIALSGGQPLSDEDLAAIGLGDEL